MPPIRSLSATKPMKTERTHEENQERAYIAASRRSDRSLEARIESARRASEIHKRRTGRSLRVTEQDVVNEEMYEEEDDDLPMQYRRLTAHLDTNSADFNRRLAAYMTNHVAMRSALNEAISNSYPQQATSNGQQQWPQNTQTAQPHWAQPPPRFSDGMVPPHMLHRASNSFRHQPYPTPQAGGYQPRQTTQIAAKKPHADRYSRSPLMTKNIKAEDRSSSVAVPMSAPPPRSSPDTFRRSVSAASLPNFSAGSPSLEDNEAISTIPTCSSPTAYPSYQQTWNQPYSLNTSPLTTAMPAETQYFFGGSNGFNTSTIPMWGSEKMQSPTSYQGGYSLSDDASGYPVFGGMSQTLAPAMSKGNEPTNWSTPDSGTVDSGYYSTDDAFGFASDSMGNDFFSKPMFPGSGQVSGQMTPADNDWSSYINTSSWEENDT